MNSSLIGCAKSYFNKQKYLYRIVRNRITLTYAMTVYAKAF